MSCVDCSVELIPNRLWRKMSPAERKATKARQAAAQGRCASCYTTHWRAGHSTRTTWRLPELIEEAEFLFSFGTSIEEVARKLGIQQRSLGKAFDRGRAKGLTTRTVPYKPWRKE